MQRQSIRVKTLVITGLDSMTIHTLHRQSEDIRFNCASSA